MIVEVKNLYKSFDGKTAVKNISLNVERGEIFGFLGPNGSGKTTTIRMLCGLMTPDSGTGTCLGYNIFTESHLIKPLVGYVPQYFSLYKDLTVHENLWFIARVYQIENYKVRVRELMDELKLSYFKDKYAGNLSGGWKQRLSLAAALIHEPKLLLLDEPTAGVDPKARREFWDDIATLTSRGISALVSTHYMDEAERCNRLAYVVYGNLMAAGTIPEIIAQANLTTFLVSGRDLNQLAIKLRAHAEIEQVVVWGNDLRICGEDRAALSALTMQYAEFQWQLVPTSLEEVFIHLVEQRPLDADGESEKQND